MKATNPHQSGTREKLGTSGLTPSRIPTGERKHYKPFSGDYGNEVASNTLLAHRGTPENRVSICTRVFATVVANWLTQEANNRPAIIRHQERD
ncbi:hypothetical protein MMC08_000746 [Hypocenomyce scalaris]|nr:hypothetical protein [Hypocenomyce scalaris]